MLPSSISVAEELHVRVSPTEGLFGDMAADVEKLGDVFSMVTEAVLKAVSPSESVAVAEQTIESPTSVSEASIVYVEPVPTVVLPTVHVYVGVILPSSTSVALAEHVSSVSV